MNSTIICCGNGREPAAFAMRIPAACAGVLVALLRHIISIRNRYSRRRLTHSTMAFRCVTAVIGLCYIRAIHSTLVCACNSRRIFWRGCVMWLLVGGMRSISRELGRCDNNQRQRVVVAISAVSTISTTISVVSIISVSAISVSAISAEIISV